MRIRFMRRWWNIFLILAILIQPDITTQNRITFLFFAGLDIIIFLILFYDCIKQKKYPKELIYWGIFRCYLLLAMIINGNYHDIDKWGRLTIVVSNFILLIRYFYKKNEMNSFFYCLSLLGIVYLSLNFLSVIIFPDGITADLGGRYFFLGTRNSMVSFFYPFLVSSGILYFRKKNRIFFYITTIFVVFFSIYFQISTSIVILISLFIMILFYNFFRKFNKLKITIPFSIITNISFIFLNASRWFRFIIVNFLKKDLGLNSRTELWGIALRNIFDSKIKLIFGHGIVNDGNFINYCETFWPGHNQLIQWLFELGIFGTACLFVFLISFDKNKDSKDTYFVRSLIFAISLGCIASNFLDISCVYMLFIILKYISKEPKAGVEKYGY